jgi:hypothetical protein
VLGTERTGLNDQFHLHQHRIQSSSGHCGEHLCHHLVTTVMTHQAQLEHL